MPLVFVVFTRLQFIFFIIQTVFYSYSHLERERDLRHLEESKAGIDGLPLALIHFYALLSQEYSHSLQPAFHIGYSLLASQDKIFHGLSRNWIWIENSRATGRGLRFFKCSFSITTDWLGKGKALTWITRSSQGGNISVGGLDWREMPNGLLVLMCFSVTYFVSTGLF